ncbi:MAG: hypothetical protein DHS20C02_00070 [Micavibrio sp.]|nr:MAG: hypothetical protein DHS20C02_00070 [Micavibrio sp.]
MAMKENYIPGRQSDLKAMPFESAEEAWFWFIQAQEARNEGARFVNGLGKAARPCEPVDILKVLDSLYRQRRLLRDHLLVLRHYGRRLLPPDRKRVKEMRAWDIWREALERLEPPLIRKGIVEIVSVVPNANWYEDFKLYEGMVAK